MLRDTVGKHGNMAWLYMCRNMRRTSQVTCFIRVSHLPRPSLRTPHYSVTERRSEGPSRAPHPLDKPFGTFSSFPPPTRNDTMPPKYRIEVTCPKHFYTSLFGKKHAVPVNIRVYENSTKRLATYVHGCTGARVFAVRCVLYAVVRLAAVAAAVAAAVCSGIG